MIALPQLLFATDLLMVVCALLFAGCFGFGVGLAGFAGARRAAYRDFIIAHQRSVAVRAARIIENAHLDEMGRQFLAERDHGRA